MKRRRAGIERGHPSLSVVRQCWLLGISRLGLYYTPKPMAEEDLALMKLIDCQYLRTPFYGARKMAAWLGSQGTRVNRKRGQQLMCLMGLRAAYPASEDDDPGTGAPAFPVSVQEHEHQFAEPGLGCGQYLHPYGAWFPVPGGRDGLAQPVCPVAATVQHARGGLLYRGAGRSPQHGEASSRATNSPGGWRGKASASAWTGRAATATICSSNGCGAR